MDIEGSVSITKSSGWFEMIYAEWKGVSGADGYNVYCISKNGEKLLDKLLVRQYSGYFRADAVGFAEV